MLVWGSPQDLFKALTPEIDRIRNELHRKMLEAKSDREKEDVLDVAVDCLHRVAAQLAQKVSLLPVKEVLRVLPGFPLRDDNIMLYEEFLERYVNQLQKGTVSYIENAKILYSRFRGLTYFDRGLVIIELAKAFEEEFRPRFIKRLELIRSKLSHAIRMAAGLEDLDKTSFGVWLQVLKNASIYPGLGLSEETRRRLLSGLVRVKELRDKAAHAQPKPLEEIRQRDAEEIAKKILAIKDGLLCLALSL
jgi:hypothetical protein